MKLVRKDDHSVAIIGTLEKLPGMAGITGAYREADGSIGVSYGGQTEVWWDAQTTEVDHKGQRIFIDENRDTVGEDEVELVDGNEEMGG